MNVPQAILDAEASVLGAVIIHTDPLEALAAVPDLTPEDFFSPKHQSVFAAMRTVEARGGAIDVVTLENELERVEKLESLGGVAFLGQLAATVPTALHLVEYATIVREHAQRRRLCVLMNEVLVKARDPERDTDELLSVAHEGLADIDHERPSDAMQIGDAVALRWDECKELMAARERGELALSGYPTGVDTLDALIGGWQPGIVQVIAARPAMGKSSMALSGAAAASFAGFGVHVFSQEDSRQAYTDRVLARHSLIPAETIRNASVTSSQIGSLVRAVGEYRGRKGWLVDFTGGLTAEQIIRRVRRHLRENRTQVVYVDYVQLVAKRDPRQNENDALTEIMNQFATAAKQDHVSYVVLSQLNRELEKRNNRRPCMNDLRGSGGLEQAARIIVSLYRGSYYTPAGPTSRDDWDCACAANVEKCQHTPTREEWHRMAELGVIKNNNGRTGRVFATWEGAITRLS